MLTIETSTPAERVAVVSDGSLLNERTETVGRGHTEKLLGVVESVLSRSGKSLADLDAIAVSIGPGRFSGLRVGLATAKGLAAASGLPVAPVESLTAMAETARPHEGLVCPMFDARRGEVYGALFRLGAGRDRLLPDAAVAPEDMVARVLEVAPNEPILFVGSGAAMYADAIAAGAGDAALFPETQLSEPSSVALAAVATERTLPDPGTSAALEPVYLRGI